MCALIQGPAGRRTVLETGRTVLTSWLPEDAADLAEVHGDASTMLYVRQGRPESLDEVTRLVAAYIAEDEAQGFTKWRVAWRDGRFIGRAGFDAGADGREIACVVRRDLWGQGLATEIARGLIGWHREHASGIPLLATVAVGNDASMTVLRRLGFQDTGPTDVQGTPCRAFVHPVGGSPRSADPCAST